MEHQRLLLPTLLAASMSALVLGSSLAFADGDRNHDDDDDDNGNIITSVVAPPVVANGTIAGEPTEFVAFLNAPGVPAKLALDPVNFGHQIPAGGHLELELGGTFERNGVDNAKPFVPVTPTANFLLVTGLPQAPIVHAAGAGVQHGNYSVVDGGGKLLTLIPNGGSGANGLENDRANSIGFKVVHLRPNPNTGSGPAPFTNGPAGTKGTVTVRIFDANGNVVESGKRSIRFPQSLGRIVGITNAGLATGGQGSPATVNVETVESVTFQHVAPNTVLENTVRPAGMPFSAGTPYAPRFLLFEEQALQSDSFVPFKGIAGVGYVVDEHKPWKADVVEDSNANGVPDQDDHKIGEIRIKGPSRNSTGTILPSMALTSSGDGVSGPNGSVFNVPVQVGADTGVYAVKVSLEDSSEAVTTLIVE
jgi:hypothetical protein